MPVQVRHEQVQHARPALPAQDRHGRAELAVVAVVEAEHDRPPRKGVAEAPVVVDLPERDGVVAAARQPGDLAGEVAAADVELRVGRSRWRCSYRWWVPRSRS